MDIKLVGCAGFGVILSSDFEATKLKLWVFMDSYMDTGSSSLFKGIKAFQELAGDDFSGGVILYAGKEAVPFGKNLWAVPFFVLW